MRLGKHVNINYHRKIPRGLICTREFVTHKLSNAQTQAPFLNWTNPRRQAGTNLSQLPLTHSKEDVTLAGYILSHPLPLPACLSLTLSHLTESTLVGLEASGVDMIYYK